MRKICTAAAALAVVGLVATGCGGGSDSGGSGQAKVGASLIARQVPFFAILGEGLAAGAKASGMDLSTVYAEFNPADQLSSVENLLAAYQRTFSSTGAETAKSAVSGAASAAD